MLRPLTYFLGAFLLVLIVYLAIPQKSDVAKWKELNARSHVGRVDSDSTLPDHMDQKRRQLIKEIHVHDQGQTVAMRLKSDGSQVAVSKEGVVEELENLQLLIQKELYYAQDGAEPMQTVRVIVADSGWINYKSKELKAEGIHFFQYELPGHELPESVDGLTPSISGIAERFKGRWIDGIEMLAHGVTATMESGPIHFVAESARYEGIHRRWWARHVTIMSPGKLHLSAYSAEYAPSLERTIFSGGVQDKFVKAEGMRGDVPFSISSRRLMVQGLNLQDMRAEEDVHVTYDQLYLARGDIAHFKEGIMCLYAKEEERVCEVIRGNDTRLQANELIWNEEERLLTLRDQIEAEVPKFWGRAEDFTEIQWRLGQNEWVIRKARADGEVAMSYRDDLLGSDNRLHCYGQVVIDHDKHHVSCYSPKQATSAKQVSFQDVIGAIYADRVEFDYEMEGKNPVPTYVLLEGNVRVRNRFTGSFKSAGKLDQFALADRLEFHPNTKKMVLYGLGGRRVIFFDRLNQVQISAPLIKMLRSWDNKQSIEGEGDVRLRLMKQEIEDLIRHFPQ